MAGFVQGVGEYTKSGQSRTVAIAIRPEFGTVGPELIRDAAKEAVKFANLLVVCGFAFDPLAGEEASTFGRLTILQARMNPDLALGDGASRTPHDDTHIYRPSSVCYDA